MTKQKKPRYPPTLLAYSKMARKGCCSWCYEDLDYRDKKIFEQDGEIHFVHPDCLSAMHVTEKLEKKPEVERKHSASGFFTSGSSFSNNYGMDKPEFNKALRKEVTQKFFDIKKK